MSSRGQFSNNNRYDRIAAERAKELRQNMTQQEQRLWYGFLRGYPLQFYRQRPVDRYILDFYCSKAKLAVELDGGQHFSGEELVHDLNRTEALNRMGIQVLRFSNADVDRNFRTVCSEIDRTVKSRTAALIP